jgi:uncharacterized protein
MPAFWDASALVPLCVPGQSDARGRKLLSESAPVIWWGTPVEVASAIARLQRDGVITVRRADAARERLESLKGSCREVEPTAEVRDLAVELLESYELHAADAIQLAAALVWCNWRAARRLFYTNDRQLTRAARAAGFVVMAA